ncbi:MAG TPA: PAS domain-containing protein [Caulobacteraceae bacterium]|nr:PAS domain-containing protein [Caulobacteraceae bacterium]
MQRFVLQQNIKRFRALMAEEREARSLTTLRTLLTDAERNLALMDARDLGLFPLGPVQGPADRLRQRDREFARLFERAEENYLLVDPNPGLRLVDINEACAAATLTSRSEIVGERLFDVFPDNPEEPHADGVSNVFHSLRLVAETRKPHRMAIQRYDVRDAEGTWVTRYWRQVNQPIFSDAGDLVRILLQVEDVTDRVPIS